MADLEKLGKVNKKAVTALKSDVSGSFDAVNGLLGDIKESLEEAGLFNIHAKKLSKVNTFFL